MSQTLQASDRSGASDTSLEMSSKRRSRLLPPIPWVAGLLLLTIGQGCQTNRLRIEPISTTDHATVQSDEPAELAQVAAPDECRDTIGPVEKEQDWFAAHEAWKEDVQSLTGRLLRDLSEEQAMQVRLLRRLHSDGAYLQCLHTHLTQNPPAELDAGLIQSLRDLEYRWAALEEWLTRLPGAESTVTDAADDRIEP